MSLHATTASVSGGQNKTLSNHWGAKCAHVQTKLQSLISPCAPFTDVLQPLCRQLAFCRECLCFWNIEESLSFPSFLFIMLCFCIPRRYTLAFCLKQIYINIRRCATKIHYAQPASQKVAASLRHTLARYSLWFPHKLSNNGSAHNQYIL